MVQFHYSADTSTFGALALVCSGSSVLLSTVITFYRVIVQDFIYIKDVSSAVVSRARVVLVVVVVVHQFILLLWALFGALL
jgi:hypothetical protein